MDALDWAALARLVPEVVIVAVFVWFSLERDKRTEEAQSKRQETRMKHEAAQSQMWRDFLSEERQWRAAASMEVVKELAQLTAAVSSTNALMVSHDTTTKVMAYQRRKEFEPIEEPNKE